MTSQSQRLVVLVLLLVSMGLLIPGLVAPVLSMRAELSSEGIVALAPQILESGLDEETVKALTGMLNPALVAMAQAFGGDIRQMIIDQLSPQITKSLQANMGDVEVYAQTRSIIGSVQNLYEVGSPVPATLILLFSVIVPVTKAVLVAWAFFLAPVRRRHGTLRFVEAIAKWSMADVFVVALFIAYLAAQATQTTPADAGSVPIVSFTAAFGPGFYWFTAYCLFSLASQQYTARLAGRAVDAVADIRM